MLGFKTPNNVQFVILLHSILTLEFFHFCIGFSCVYPCLVSCLVSFSSLGACLFSFTFLLVACC